MTLQEAKEQVAKNHGYDSWNQVIFYAIDAMAGTAKPPYAEQALNEEAAELYARSKWDEACEAMKGRICDVYGMSVDQATNPEFKP